jgi:hypothetical protein
MAGRFNFGSNTVIILIVIGIILVWFFSNPTRSSFGGINANFLAIIQRSSVYKNVHAAEDFINYVYDTVNKINTNGSSKNFKKYFSGPILNIDKNSLINSAVYLSDPNSTFIPLLASQIQKLTANISKNINSKQKTTTGDYQNLDTINKDLKKINDIANDGLAGGNIKDLIDKYTSAFNDLFSQFVV